METRVLLSTASAQVTMTHIFSSSLIIRFFAVDEDSSPYRLYIVHRLGTKRVNIISVNGPRGIHVAFRDF
jgi:hypothetical protein